MLNIVLFEPEIPANTGTIGRSCVLTDSRLHLIEPLGFSLDDRMIRRAGMGYWHDLDVTAYPSWEAFTS
ncbi:MAG: tRNA (cytidine(34)-2'-O)-methyltransferase, partial [Coriobacteriales bacterium]